MAQQKIDESEDVVKLLNTCQQRAAAFAIRDKQLKDKEIVKVLAEVKALKGELEETTRKGESEGGAREQLCECERKQTWGHANVKRANVLTPENALVNDDVRIKMSFSYALKFEKGENERD